MLFLFLIFGLYFLSGGSNAEPLTSCPMTNMKNIIRYTVNITKKATEQLQVIKYLTEKLYGGKWGVIIVEDTDLVSNEIHWNIPDQKLEDGSSAFCLHVHKNWQYSVFKTVNGDTENRLSIDELIDDLQRPSTKKEPSNLRKEL